jgi:F-type H+-transporting ATPase subunit epsilon
VTGGNRVAIACRQAVLGDDLETLEAQVHVTKAEETEADRKARVEQLRFHTLALRQIVRYLMPGQALDGFASRNGEHNR